MGEGEAQREGRSGQRGPGGTLKACCRGARICLPACLPAKLLDCLPVVGRQQPLAVRHRAACRHTHDVSPQEAEGLLLEALQVRSHPIAAFTAPRSP